MKKIILFIGLSILVYFLYFKDTYAHQARAGGYNMQINANIETAIPGFHEAIIENNTDYNQEYSYQFQICVNKFLCSDLENFSGHVQLKPHSFISHSAETIVKVTLYRGSYPITINTRIFGETNAEYTAYGTLKVY